MWTPTPSILIHHPTIQIWTHWKYWNIAYLLWLTWTNPPTEPSTHQLNHQNHPFRPFYHSNFGFLKIRLFTIHNLFFPIHIIHFQHLPTCQHMLIYVNHPEASPKSHQEPVVVSRAGFVVGVRPVGLWWLPPRPSPAAAPVPAPPAASAAPSLGAPPGGCARAPPDHLDDHSKIKVVKMHRKCTEKECSGVLSSFVFSLY